MGGPERGPERGPEGGPEGGSRKGGPRFVYTPIRINIKLEIHCQIIIKINLKYVKACLHDIFLGRK